MKDYPALSLLIQGYLTLDWPDDYTEWWEAIDDFIANEPSAPSLGSEIDELLASSASEQALSSFVLDTLGSGYLPSADGLTTRDFLKEVRRRAENLQGSPLRSQGDGVDTTAPDNDTSTLLEAFAFLSDRGFQPSVDGPGVVRFESPGRVFVRVHWDAREHLVGFRVGHIEEPRDALTDAELVRIEGDRLPRTGSSYVKPGLQGAAQSAAQILDDLGDRALSGDPTVFAEAMELRRVHTQRYSGDHK